MHERRKNMITDTMPEEVVKFMTKELGGRAEVLFRFNKAQIVKLARKGGTIKNLLDQASEGGWEDDLLEVKLTDLADAINPPDKETPPKKEPDKGRRSAQQQEADRAVIHEYVKQHAWCSSREIGKILGRKTSHVRQDLNKLMADERIRKSGEKAATVYADIDTKEPPPSIAPHQEA